MSYITEVALERVNSLVVVVNNQGKVEYVSPSVKRILGFEPNQLLGDGWWNLTRDNKKDRKRIQHFVQLQLEQKELTETKPEARLLKTSTGGERWILWNTSKGLFNKIIAIGQDVTEQKRQEEQQRQRMVEVLQQHNDILASIRYASQIQRSILPSQEKLKNIFPESFILNKPRDVVSGDFYFFHQLGDKKIVITADCTGHGVPGALMTMIASSILKELVVKRQIFDPVTILYELDQELYQALHQDDPSYASMDGMDVSIGVFDQLQNTLTYAGAFRPMLLVRGDELIEFEANRFPIGFYGDVKKQFESRTIFYLPGDTCYFFTDGFCDQFGGEEKKKFNRKRFKEMLLSVHGMSLEEQHAFLRYALLNWQQEEEQVDDVLVVGVRC